MLKKIIIFSIPGLICLSSISFAQSFYDYELKLIKFSGNNYFSQSDLETIIESKETPMWFWSFLNSFTPFGDEPVFFDSSKISIDKLALEEYYRSNGYFRISVKDSIVADSTDKTVELYYQITENKPFNYGKISFFGLNKLSEFDYSKIMLNSEALDSSKQYSESDVQNKISSINRNLVNNGYVFGSYDSTLVSIDTLSFRTDVNLYFNTGDKYSISQTIVNKSGNSIQQITNELITEIADIKPGSVYDQSQLDRSELRLIKTELFNSLDINPVISDTSKFTIPVEINASIGSLNELSPEIKADNEFSSFNTGLGISYTRKNLFGDARRFNISASFRLIDIPNYNFANVFRSAANRDSTYQGIIDLKLKMEQPFLFGRPILTSTELYLQSQSIIEYTENTYGGAQRFDFEMPPYTFITLLRPFISFDIAQRELKDLSANSNFQYLLSVTSFTPGIGIEFGSSKTNDILFPTKGSYLFFTPELFHSKTDLKFVQQNDSTVGGTIYFYRLQTGVSNYLSLSNNRSSVFASKLRIGYAKSITSSKNPLITSEQLIPPNKTFYAGGSNSVRGWGSRELIPSDTVSYFGVTTETSALRGGTFWLEGSFEFRKKLMEYFGYALFVDYGNTWNGLKEMQVQDIAVSVGFGIRVYTPIAPFRLDFGSKFYNPADQSLIFQKKLLKNISIQFGIGEAF